MRLIIVTKRNENKTYAKFCAKTNYTNITRNVKVVVLLFACDWSEEFANNIIMNNNVLKFTTPLAVVQDTERTGRQTAKKRSFQNFPQPKQWRVEEIENLSGLLELVFMVFLWRICGLFWDARDIN